MAQAKIYSNQKVATSADLNKGIEKSKAAIKRAFKKGSILEWHRSVIADFGVLDLAIEALGKKNFGRVVDKWPGEKPKALKEALLEKFSGDFFEDGDNYQARRWYAWMFGDLYTACFADRTGKIAFKDKKEAQIFAQGVIQEWGKVEFERLSGNQESLRLVAQYILPRQIGEAGLGLNDEQKRRIAGFAKELNKEAYKAMVLSDLWPV